MKKTLLASVLFATSFTVTAAEYIVEWTQEGVVAQFVLARENLETRVITYSTVAGDKRIYKDLTVVDGNMYRYTIVSMNKAGTSEDSEAAYVVVDGDCNFTRSSLKGTSFTCPVTSEVPHLDN